ncbi:hypothetical protein [Streptomyces sp. NPDC015350]|uniref:hypothetical protein n=1 Tax=Streptomyces sp. NPDC015350 TaxID=3364955 RepID=UPI0037004CE8
MSSRDTGGSSTGTAPPRPLADTAAPPGQGVDAPAAGEERAVRAARETIGLVLNGTRPQSAADGDTLMLRLRGHLMVLLTHLSPPGHPTGLVEAARRLREQPTCEDPTEFFAQLQELAELTRKVIAEIQKTALERSSVTPDVLTAEDPFFRPAAYDGKTP